jgi:hypothetical protein
MYGYPPSFGCPSTPRTFPRARGQCGSLPTICSITQFWEHPQNMWRMLPSWSLVLIWAWGSLSRAWGIGAELLLTSVGGSTHYYQLYISFNNYQLLFFWTFCHISLFLLFWIYEATNADLSLLFVLSPALWWVPPYLLRLLARNPLSNQSILLSWI